MTKTVKEIVAEIKETLDKKGGLKHVYFVACGGSKAAIFPGLYLLQSEAKTFSATTYTSNEFVHATPKELDDRCVAVICSLKATAETVEAVKKANSIGAITIAMTGNMDTGMAKVGQYVVTYSNGDDRFTAIPTRPTPYGSALSCCTSLRAGTNTIRPWRHTNTSMRSWQKERKTAWQPQRNGQIRKKTSLYSMYWLPVPTMA